MDQDCPLFFYREAHSHYRDERAKPHKTYQNKYNNREVKELEKDFTYFCDPWSGN